jgi:long-chain acyl-CoA synthetase
MIEASRGLKNIKNILVKTDGPIPPSAFSFDEITRRNPPTFDMVSVRPDDLAVLMYTSGTTGSPKGVMLSHGNISSNVEAAIPAWPTGPEDTMLIPLPLNHIFGLLMINECNLTGARIVLHKWFDPRAVLQSIARHKVTQFVGVPTMYIRLVEAYDPVVHTMQSIRRLLCAGAPLSTETIHLVESRWRKPLFQGYGMTETSPTIARQREDRPRKPGSTGPAIDGVEIKIFDELDRGLPPGEVGEVCVRGPNVMKGYLHKEAETQVALRKGWLHTGDMGYLDEDGDLFLTDRKKDLIIRGGENISPGALEEILYKHPAVLEAAVVGIPDPVYGEEVKAFVVLKPGAKVSERELIDLCLKFTPRFRVPKTIAFLNELPKTSVGKILKRALRERGKG